MENGSLYQVIGIGILAYVFSSSSYKRKFSWSTFLILRTFTLRKKGKWNDCLGEWICVCGMNKIAVEGEDFLFLLLLVLLYIIGIVQTFMLLELSVPICLSRNKSRRMNSSMIVFKTSFRILKYMLFKEIINFQTSDGDSLWEKYIKKKEKMQTEKKIWKIEFMRWITKFFLLICFFLFCSMESESEVYVEKSQSMAYLHACLSVCLLSIHT